MMRPLAIMSVGMFLFAGAPLTALADEEAAWEENREQAQETTREMAGAGEGEWEEYGPRTVYGWQLMSEEERMAHRNKMRAMKTREEREAYRRQHHEMMKARAKEMGVALPEEPMGGMGPGMGGGMGGGMGPGMGGGRR